MSRIQNELMEIIYVNFEETMADVNDEPPEAPQVNLTELLTRPRITDDTALPF